MDNKHAFDKSRFKAANLLSKYKKKKTFLLFWMKKVYYLEQCYEWHPILHVLLWLWLWQIIQVILSRYMTVPLGTIHGEYYWWLHQELILHLSRSQLFPLFLQTSHNVIWQCPQLSSTHSHDTCSSPPL